jgi:O-antigen/teichoic acid export membrane protein
LRLHRARKQGWPRGVAQSDDNVSEQQGSLREAALSGVRWITLARAASEVLAFAAAVVLARLIAPAEFGRAAVALIFVPLAGILMFEGFASALVQRPSYTEAHRRSAVFTSLVGGAALSAIAFALTGPLWTPLFGAPTGRLIALMSPIFVIAGVGTVSRAMLWRQLDFRRIGLIDVGTLLIGNGLAVALAIAGFGAKAIVLGALAKVATESALLFACAPAPLPRWHGRAQREIGGFGLPAALAGLVGVLFRNVAYAILAARLSATQTGIYWRSYNLGVVYQDKISGVMMQLSFPVYSRTESRDELRRLHERAARVHAAVLFPLLTTLIVLAPVLIPFVFGPNWEASIRPAQILAVAGMIAAVLTGYPQVMLAVGRPKALLRFNIVMVAVFSAVVALAATHGLIVVSVCVVAVYLAILLAVYRFLLQPAIGLSVRNLAPELGPAVLGCLALAAVGFPLRALLESLPAGAFVTLVVVGGAGLLAYALVLQRLFAPLWNDMRMLAERVVPPLARLGRRRGQATAPAATAPSHGSAS